MRLVLLALAACSSSSPKKQVEPMAPIVGDLVVGAPWPVRFEGAPAAVKAYATLDGKPIAVQLLIACGKNIGSLVVERVFYAGDDKPLLDKDALHVPDPVDRAIKLATEWIQTFERQGFAIEGQFGGSVEAIQELSTKLAGRRAKGEDVNWKDIPQQAPDRAQLQQGNSLFMVIMKRGNISRSVQVGNIAGRSKVDVAEDMECPTGRQMIDFDAPEVVLPSPPAN